jgi:hypothetical protein
MAVKSAGKMAGKSIGKSIGKSAGKSAKRGGKCPICGKPRIKDYSPFCSKRCADVDLNRWLSGQYAVPGEPAGSIPQPDDDEN